MTDNHPFDESYFKTAAYADVSFQKYGQYWWSNRFYVGLARKHGPQHGRVLEVGCGLGHLLEWLVLHYQVFGTDINTWALQQASKNVPAGHFTLLAAEDLRAFPDGVFQIVIAKHVVEHLPEPERAMAELARVTAPGGLLLLATPNLDSVAHGWKKQAWIGYKDPTHISLKPPAEWLAMLRGKGFRVKKVFSDGLWDAPYLPLLPKALQKLIFGIPGGLQAILGWSIIPLRLGESLIVLATKQG